MKFKQNNEEPQEKVGMSKELHDAFVDLIQFEVNKLSLIGSAKAVFFERGEMHYKKFFKFLYKKCEETKHCLVGFLVSNLEEVPELKIPKMELAFDSSVVPFEKLADMEDEFEEKLNKMIGLAFEDKNWKAFHYLLKKLDCIDHICCRALAAINNKADVLALLPCEQRTSEN